MEKEKKPRKEKLYGSLYVVKPNKHKTIRNEGEAM